MNNPNQNVQARRNFMYGNAQNVGGTPPLRQSTSVSPRIPPPIPPLPVASRSNLEYETPIIDTRLSLNQLEAAYFIRGCAFSTILIILILVVILNS